MKASAKARADRMRETVAAVAFRNAGLRKGLRGAAFLVCWGLASEAIEGPMNMHRYVGYWGTSTATAYREFEAFRLAFPGEATPTRLWSVIRDQVPARDRIEAVAQGCSAVLS